MAFVAVFARLGAARCASRQQRGVVTPVAGKIVGAIVIDSAVNGVTGRGAKSGTVVRFSIIRILVCIVVAIAFTIGLALLGPAFAERPITTSYGIQVAKLCGSLPMRLGRGFRAHGPTQDGREVGSNILQFVVACCSDCCLDVEPC